LPNVSLLDPTEGEAAAAVLKAVLPILVNVRVTMVAEAVRFGQGEADPILPLARMEVTGVAPNGQVVDVVISPRGPARVGSDLAPPVR
jgi:hypothetical protein